MSGATSTGLTVRVGSLLAALGLATLGLATMVAVGAEPEPHPLRFTRVHVPAGRLGDVDLGTERRVPLPVAEFDRLVAAALAAPSARGATDAPRPLADAGRITCRFDATGRPVGTLVLSYPDGPTAPPADVALGRFAVRRAARETAEGTGPALIHALADGATALRIAGPGTYRCDWEGDPSRPVTGAGSAPLVVDLPVAPALATVVEIEVPEGRYPVGGGVAWEAIPAEPVADAVPGTAPTGRRWQAVVGPVAALAVRFESAVSESVGLRSWTTYDVGPGAVTVRTVLEPVSDWIDGVVELRIDHGVTLISASVAAGSERGRVLPWTVREGAVKVSLPAALAGTPMPLAIVGIAPAGADTVALPRFLTGADEWRGGGMTLRVDPALALTGLEADEAISVAPTAAAAWPALSDTEPGADGALVHLSAQGPEARVTVTVEPRGPLLDIARATTVDIAAARVIGVAICDVRVPRGEAFVLTGRIGPGWIIDAVEQGVPGGRPGDVVASRPNARPDEAIEWRVSADAAGSRLRVGLAAAATPARPLALRITGHRTGLDVGGALAVRDLEMVALDGEGEGQAALVLRPPTDAMLDIEPAPAALPPPVSRVAALLGSEPVRSWLPAGSALPAAEVRLVRRRPPVTVHCRVGMTVRDDRVAETYVFECQPGEAALDSLVVHFSEPIEEFAEWTLLRPGSGSVVARPVDLPGRRGGESSWLIDLVPPARETVTIRAARSVALAGVTPVPLARVEGAVAFAGEVVVRTAGRRRPTVVNRRLTELPPAPTRPGDADAIVAEFGFDGDAVTAAAAEGPALELVPDGGGGERDAGAWVWSQTVDCWCHRSGLTEVESRFAIENHGRPSLTLQLPPGNRLQAILIDGRRVVTDRDGAVGELSLDLPVDQRRVALTVRSIAAEEAAAGWFVSSAGATVDLPVLERAWRVWLPPGIDLLSGPRRHREVGAPGLDWCRRLFGFDVPSAGPVPPEDSASGSGGLVAGCRERVFVPLPGPPADDRVGLIASEDLERIAFLAGTLLTGCLLAAAAWRPGVLTLGPLVAGLAALWVPAPWHVVARAVWWGMAAAFLASLTARRWRGDARAAALVALALVAGRAHGDDATGVNVIVTPVGGVPTALVPESLFDRLGAAGSGARPRVLGVELTIPGPQAAAWGVRVEIDADPGSSLVVPRAPGTVPAEGVVLVDGRRVPLLGSDRGEAWVPITEAGRHRVEWSVIPERIDRGAVTVEMAAFPAAPRAVATVGPGPLSRGPLVEMARPGGPFAAAPRDTAWSEGALGAYDVAGADRVALVVAPPAVVVDPVPRAARSRNDIVWGPTACRVESRFEIEMGDDLVPAVVLNADPRLVPEPVDDPAIALEPLAQGRFRVVRVRPEPGPFRFGLAWTLPLDEPTGVHPLPEVWLDAPRADERTVRLTPATGLRAALLSSGPVPGARPVASGAELSWRVERGAADAAAPPLDGLPAAAGVTGAGRVLVTRAPPVARGTQQLRLALNAGRIDMTLQARIEADGAVVAIPLRARGDVQLGNVTLTDETGAEGTRQALDVRLVAGKGADGPGTWTVVLQRPRAGRLRLDVEAFVAAPLPAEGDLPSLQALLEGSGPLVVTWSAVDGMAAEVAGAEAAAAGVFELPPDAPPTGYRLVAVPRRGDEPAAPVPGPTPPAAPTAPSGPRLELVDTVLAVDARGRGWGVARLDVVALDPILRLSLPGGCRPYKVFVDGRSVSDPVPVGSAQAPRWEIRLFDVRWPRSLEVIFAGELGAGIDGGDLTALDAPGIDGLPAAATLWTIMVPRATALRVAPPAAIVPVEALAGERAAALERLAADFSRAIAAVAPAEATRLGDLLTARRSPPSLRGFDTASVGTTGADAFAVGAAVVGPGNGAPLVFRLVRGTDTTAPARALVSAAAVVACGILRVVWRRLFPAESA